MPITFLKSLSGTTVHRPTPYTVGLNVNFLVVGAGGGAGASGYYNGGGGGGGLICSGVALQGGGGTAQNSISVYQYSTTCTIGVGGTSGRFYAYYGGYTGSSSTFLNHTAQGGGGGGAFGVTGGNPAGLNPAIGGCGGGSGTMWQQGYGPAAGAAGTANQGYGGGTGAYEYANAGGGGGGAGGVGQPPTGPNYRYVGMGGLGVQWIDGLYYSCGGFSGRSGNYPSDTNRTPPAGYTAFANNGTGGGSDFLDASCSLNANSSGSDGVVILRYYGAKARATGGTITLSKGIVTHTFTSTANFVVNFNFL